MNSIIHDLISRKNTKLAGPGGYTLGLLKMLGVPQDLLYVRKLGENASFWVRKIDHLHILEQARQLYRQKIVCVHPDKSGGNLEQTIQLNRAWGEIERRFKQHGYELW